MENEKLPDGWRWTTLGDIARPAKGSIVSGPFGSNIGSRFFVEQGIPVIRGNNLTSDMRRFIDDGFVFITEEKAYELRNCEAVKDDLIFTAAGSLGQVGIIPPNSRYQKYIISNKQLRARLNDEVIDPLFAFYWFASPRMVEYVQQRNTGSTIPLINLGILRALPIPLPPLPTQQAIAHILGALDDKIDLNRRMNATLESIAHSIFKSWFIDFDPVNHKISGQQENLPQQLATLFPDSFVETTFGQLPKGWSYGKVCDFGKVICGKTPPTNEKDNYGEDIPFITIPDMHNQIFVIETNKKLSFKGAKSQENKTLPEKSICVSCIATPGLVIITSGSAQTNQQINSLIPRKEKFTYYCYYCLKGLADEIKIRGSGGSVVTNLNKGQFENLPVLVAPDNVINAFHDYVAPIFQNVLSNEIQSRTLASLRDLLLPRLISGKLRIPDYERILEKVM